MASTARNDDETKEYFDPPEELDRKVSLLAQWIKESKHMIAFTVSTEPYMHCALIIAEFFFLFFFLLQGAGISTAAGSK